MLYYGGNKEVMGSAMVKHEAGGAESSSQWFALKLSKDCLGWMVSIGPPKVSRLVLKTAQAGELMCTPSWLSVEFSNKVCQNCLPCPRDCCGNYYICSCPVLHGSLLKQPKPVTDILKNNAKQFRRTLLLSFSHHAKNGFSQASPAAQVVQKKTERGCRTGSKNDCLALPPQKVPCFEKEF